MKHDDETDRTSSAVFILDVRIGLQTAGQGVSWPAVITPLTRLSVTRHLSTHNTFNQSHRVQMKALHCCVGVILVFGYCVHVQELLSFNFSVNQQDEKKKEK